MTLNNILAFVWFNFVNVLVAVCFTHKVGGAKEENKRRGAGGGTRCHFPLLLGGSNKAALFFITVDNIEVFIYITILLMKPPLPTIRSSS